jgi:hypothetical protein
MVNKMCKFQAILYLFLLSLSFHVLAEAGQCYEKDTRKKLEDYADKIKSFYIDGDYKNVRKYGQERASLKKQTIMCKELNDQTTDRKTKTPTENEDQEPAVPRDTEDQELEITADANFDGTNLWYGKQVSKGFRDKVVTIASDLNMNPNHLMIIMNFESGGSFDPAQRNLSGSSATGLIQFMPSTAVALGTTTEALAGMTAEAQLDYVKKYYEQSGKVGKIESLDDAYLVVLYPALVGKSDDKVFGDKDGNTRSQKIYQQNSGFDKNNDGKITKKEIASTIRNQKRLEQGFKQRGEL